MEAPQSARDFLRRFHLPQLVRISSVAQDEQDSHDHGQEEETRYLGSSVRSVWRQGGQLEAFGRRRRQRQQHEQSNWIYRASVGGRRQDISMNNHLDRLDADNFSSLMPDTSAKEHEDRAEPLSLCCSTTPQRQIRTSILVPRASLSGNFKQGPKTEASRLEMNNGGFKRSVRLCPPSKRPTLSRLQLKQPFLLYKAYKKLEVCAYVIDAKNELNEKSGYPIYFPHNYTGWFSIDPETNSATNSKQAFARLPRPIETVDEVCRTGAQFFMTRDDLLGYQIPTKLSYLTKLNNNQLLALPLAINLDKQTHKGSHKGKSSKEQNNISDIKQIVIPSGQTLRVCGIYEDVLPLIEGKHYQLKQPESVSLMSHYDQHYKMATPPGEIYNYSQMNSKGNNNGYYVSDPSKLKANKVKSARAQSNCSTSGASLATTNYAPPPPPPFAAYGAQLATTRRLATKLATNDKQSVGGLTQRYVRCIMLNQNSVDKLTDCMSHTKTAPTFDQGSNVESDETEVLIPMDQRGRLYLCATNDSIVNELNCYLCGGGTGHSPHLVYKLAQIISLINLSRKLASKHILDRSNGWPDFRMKSPIKLPLNLHLVIGPRPANFSPSMFGSSSTMESYFRSERNIGGHSLDCRHNKNFVPNQAIDPLKQYQNNLKRLVCDCALRLSKASSTSEAYGTFSASLRIERIAKRDVILACTIKRDPLVRLDLLNKIQAGIEVKGCTQNESSNSFSKLTRDPLSLEGTSSALKQLENNYKDRKALKSSFSHLRACRSLISLNGRRRKRPTIPSSMILNANLSSDDLAPGGANHQNRSDCDSGAIVMIEIDCNDTELRFVRTFVESSIPTATIPDLVLNRMEFCRKNSVVWERQLKLTYGALSEDFNSCLRQITQSSRLEGRGPTLEVSTMLAGICSSRFGEGASASPGKVVSDSLHSSSSSRSSSGVSSAGERGHERNPIRHHQHQGSQTTSSSSNTCCSSGGSSSVAGSSRLLRLVQRILPPFKHVSVETATERVGLSFESQALKERRRKLVNEELVERFKKSSLKRGSQGETESSTLMNAQKVYRRLMTGSMRHLSASEQSSESCEPLRKQEPDEDSGSHLYESLERLHDKRRALGEQPLEWQADEEACPRRARRLGFGIGKSIDFLVGGRMRALASGSSFSPSSRSSSSSSSQVHETNGQRRRLKNEEDEDEDWWRDSSKESTGALSLAAAKPTLVGAEPASRSARAIRLSQEGGHSIRRTLEERKVGRSDELDGCPMEPVSIEACYDQFVSMVDDDDGDCDGDGDGDNHHYHHHLYRQEEDDNDHSDIYRSEGERIEEATSRSIISECRSERALRSALIDRTRRTSQCRDDASVAAAAADEEEEEEEEELGGSMYANLSGSVSEQTRSALKLERQWQVGGHRLAGRMERKLMRLRARRFSSYSACRADASQNDLTLIDRGQREVRQRESPNESVHSLRMHANREPDPLEGVSRGSIELESVSSSSSSLGSFAEAQGGVWLDSRKC